MLGFVKIHQKKQANNSSVPSTSEVWVGWITKEADDLVWEATRTLGFLACGKKLQKDGYFKRLGPLMGWMESKVLIRFVYIFWSTQTTI